MGVGLGRRAEAPGLLRSFVTCDAIANAGFVLCCRGVQSTAVLQYVLLSYLAHKAATCDVLNYELGWSLRPSQTPRRPRKWGREGSNPSRTLTVSTWE